jgi:hypothetical protein
MRGSRLRWRVSASSRNEDSARSRARNCPIWRPALARTSTSSAGTGRRSRENSSQTPSRVSPRRTGNATAVRGPSARAASGRRKRGSSQRSSTTTGSRRCQTNPGRPSPGTKVRSRVSACSAGTDSPGAVQLPAWDRRPPQVSGCHRVAASQSSSAQRVGSSRSNATSASGASVSAADTRSLALRYRPTASSRSSRMDVLTSRRTPTITPPTTAVPPASSSRESVTSTMTSEPFTWRTGICRVVPKSSERVASRRPKPAA